MSINPNEIVNNANDNAIGNWGVKTFARISGSFVSQPHGRRTVAVSDSPHWFLAFAGYAAWEEATAAVRLAGQSYGECRYFRASLDATPYMTRGHMGVLAYSSLPPAEQAKVRIEIAHHPNADGSPRYEAVYDGAFGGDTRDIYVVIGAASGVATDAFDLDDRDSYATYTWHPGFPIRASEISGPNGPIPEDAFVKLSMDGRGAILDRRDVDIAMLDNLLDVLKWRVHRLPTDAIAIRAALDLQAYLDRSPLSGAEREAIDRVMYVEGDAANEEEE